MQGAYGLITDGGPFCSRDSVTVHGETSGLWELWGVEEALSECVLLTLAWPC